MDCSIYKGGQISEHFLTIYYSVELFGWLFTIIKVAFLLHYHINSVQLNSKVDEAQLPSAYHYFLIIF